MMNPKMIERFQNELKRVYSFFIKQLEDEAENLKGTDDFETFVAIKKDLFSELKEEIRDRFGDSDIAEETLKIYKDKFVSKARNLDLIVSKRGIQKFEISGVRVVLFGVDLEEDYYANIIKKVYDILKSKDLLQVWYGEVYVISKLVKKTITKEEEKFFKSIGVNISYGSLVGGEYSYWDDAITLVGNIEPEKIEIENILHELGHRFYYKILSKPVRMKWNDLIRTKKHSYDQPTMSGQKTMAGKKSPIAPVSKYGSTNADEAFAEAFLFYCLNRNITPDQRNFIEKTLKNVVDESKSLETFIKLLFN